MIAAYQRLHDLGWAHSIEVSDQSGLVGGLYGVCIGKAFFGESMFSRANDASKTALAAIVWLARQGWFTLVDCQVPNDHLASLGSREIPRKDFERLLGKAINNEESEAVAVLRGNHKPARHWNGSLPTMAATLLENALL